MIRIGTRVELTEVLVLEDAIDITTSESSNLTFNVGHEFRVSDIIEKDGQTFYHVIDGTYDLREIDPTVFRRVSGTMTLLNETGDIEITWSDEHEASMRALIEAKLKSGYSFFIVERKLFGCIERRKKVKDISEIQKGTKLLLKDDDAVRLFEEGKISAKVNKSKRNMEAKKRTKDVDEILASDTLAVRPIAGG